MKIISRKEARIQGLPRYFTGVPCAYGHSDERYLNGRCVSCSHEYYGENRTRILRQVKARAKVKPEINLEASRRYRAKNPEKRKLIQKKWRDANRHTIEASTARRRASEVNASIPLTADEKRLVRQHFALRDWCTTAYGEPFHVDHIVPISRGGANHPSNLQVVTARYNVYKNDRLPEECDPPAICFRISSF